MRLVEVTGLNIYRLLYSGLADLLLLLFWLRRDLDLLCLLKRVLQALCLDLLLNKGEEVNLNLNDLSYLALKLR